MAGKIARANRFKGLYVKNPNDHSELTGNI